jgi:intergrase/recombinase
MIVCFTVLAVAGTAITVRGDEASDIFERCTAQLRGIVEQCHQNHQRVVRECVPRIRELLAAGRTAAAREVAERCIRQINQDARESTSRVNRLCEECVQALRELEAYELAERLLQRCQLAQQAIERSRAEAIQRIRSLF